MNQRHPSSSRQCEAVEPAVPLLYLLAELSDLCAQAGLAAPALPQLARHRALLLRHLDALVRMRRLRIPECLLQRDDAQLPRPAFLAVLALLRRRRIRRLDQLRRGWYLRRGIFLTLSTCRRNFARAFVRSRKFPTNSAELIARC